MGQFLCIGIRTGLVVDKNKLEKSYMTKEEMLTELERQLVPAHLYTRIETEEHVEYNLRADAVQDEFLSFLKEYYRIRYNEVSKKNREGDFCLEIISEYDNLADWIKLAKKKEMEAFQISTNCNGIDVCDWHYLYFHEQCIILSLTSKVWMECYNDLFKFLLNCIKLRLSGFKLKDTLSIFITD